MLLRLPTSSSLRFNAMISIFGCTAAVYRSDTLRNCETSAEAQGARYQDAKKKKSVTHSHSQNSMAMPRHKKWSIMFHCLNFLLPYILTGRAECCFLQCTGEAFRISNTGCISRSEFFSSPSFSSLSDLQNAKWEAKCSSTNSLWFLESLYIAR